MQISHGGQSQETPRPGKTPHAMARESLERAHEQSFQVRALAVVYHDKGRLAGEPGPELQRPAMRGAARRQRRCRRDTTRLKASGPTAWTSPTGRRNGNWQLMLRDAGQFPRKRICPREEFVKAG